MRDPLHWLSVKYKLALVFVGLCLLAFGVGGFLVSRSARDALEAEILTRLEFQCRTYATALDSYLALLTRRAEDFASDGYIRGHVAAIAAEGRAPRRAELRTELARHLRVNKLPLVPAFCDLVPVTAAGRPVLADPVPADIRRMWADRGKRPGNWFGGIHGPDRKHRFSTMLVATPLRSLHGGAEIGRLFVRLRPGPWILGALRAAGTARVPTGATVRLRLVDPQGQVLVVPETLTRLRDPDPASEVARQGIGLRLEAPGTGGAAPGRSYSPVHGTYSESFPIAANGWSIRVDLHAARILDAVSGLQSRLVGFAVLLAGLAALLLWLPLRYIARPLAVLKNAARRIRDGNLQARVPVDSSDEIGELAQSFNAMAAALEQREGDLRRKQEELRAQHDRLNAVIASMRDGLVVLDARGEVVLSNAAAAPFLERFEHGAGVPRNVCRLHEEGAAVDCAGCLLDPASPARSCVLDVGRGVWEVHATPLRSGAGHRRGRVLLVRDITDRVQQDETQIHQERLAVLGEVAAVMAHELNNPLTSISMFNQMLAARLPDDSPLRQNAEVIRRNTVACKQAIRELLDYATGATPEVAAVDVHDILADVVRFVRPVSQRAGIEVRPRLEAERSSIDGDEVQLRQVFVNLVMNAVQSLGDGGGNIDLVTATEDDLLVVDVVDSGPGIPDDMRDQIFRPFFTSKPRGAGTGLGLPTARRIAELHGGGLALVESAPGRTRFRVRLRLAPAAAAAEGPR